MKPLYGEQMVLEADRQSDPGGTRVVNFDRDSRARASVNGNGYVMAMWRMPCFRYADGSCARSAPGGSLAGHWTRARSDAPPSPHVTDHVW
jgi:hypothetical protein